MGFFEWVGICVGGCLLFTLIGWLIDKLIREPLHRRKIYKQNQKQIDWEKKVYTPKKTYKKED